MHTASVQSRKPKGVPSRSARELLAKETLPHNLEAERAVLGSIFRDERCMTAVAQLLKRSDFYSDKHQKIFGAMLSLYEVGFPIDLLQVGETLGRRKQLADVGGAEALLSILDDTLTSANAMYYSNIVKEKAILRSLIHAGSDMIRNGYEPDGDAHHMVARAELSLAEAMRGGDIGKEPLKFEQLISGTIDRLSEKKMKKAPAGIPTGFYELDDCLGGLVPQNLIILAARPGVGKTALAM